MSRRLTGAILFWCGLAMSFSGLFAWLSPKTVVVAMVCLPLGMGMFVVGLVLHGPSHRKRAQRGGDGGGAV